MDCRWVHRLPVVVGLVEEENWLERGVLEIGHLETAQLLLTTDRLEEGYSQLQSYVMVKTT